jgi:hypothetical protein
LNPTPETWLCNRVKSDIAQGEISEYP